MVKRLIAVMAAVAGVTWAVMPPVGEHVACRNLDYDYSNASVLELSDIAASCSDPAVAQLYYHRAYYIDLYSEGDLAQQAFQEQDAAYAYQWHSGRIYMGMLEALAGEYYPEPGERAAFLNSEYKRVGAMAELKLRGRASSLAKSHNTSDDL